APAQAISICPLSLSAMVVLPTSGLCRLEDSRTGAARAGAAARRSWFCYSRPDFFCLTLDLRNLVIYARQVQRRQAGNAAPHVLLLCHLCLYLRKLFLIPQDRKFLICQQWFFDTSNIKLREQKRMFPILLR